jgi:hypothetical protein
MRALGVVAVGLGGAIAAGIVTGALSRLLMRAVTVAADHQGSFGVSGSVFIVLIYVVAMIPGGIVAAFTTRWWRWLVLGAGSMLLFLPAVGVASEEIGGTHGLSPLRWALLILTSALVFATIPADAIVTVRLVDRWRGRTVRDSGDDPAMAVA